MEAGCTALDTPHGGAAGETTRHGPDHYEDTEGFVIGMVLLLEPVQFWILRTVVLSREPPVFVPV